VIARISHGAALAALSAAALAACAAPPTDVGTTTVTAPDRASFPVVSDFLAHRCGTLDCHGSTSRGLRLYGNEGLRLDPKSRPSSKPNTTAAEYDANFASVVGLEPELTSAVVSSAGAQPERLTLVRKARGSEAHKGGVLIVIGDDQDVCVISWLAGKTDVAACVSAREKYP
jgi:hypothetical protein